MVEMRMGQEYGVYAPGRNRKRFPVPSAKFPLLMKTTVNQKSEPIGLN
jgi:hypothetical protein